MKTYKAVPLTKEAFAPYGTFVDIYKSSSESTDALVYIADTMTVGTDVPATAIGVLHTDYSGMPALTPFLEYHNTTEEGWIVMNGDCVALFATAAPTPQESEHTEAFYIKAGTCLAIKKGVWHFAPAAAHEGRLSVYAVLPPKVYEYDLIKYDLEEPIKIEF